MNPNIGSREDRLEEQALLEKEIDLLVEAIKSGYEDSDYYDRFVEAEERLTQLYRINRAEVDVAYFAMQYFSEEDNPDNDSNLIPEGVKIEDMSDFHKELCQLLSGISNGTKRTNVAWACPRSHAKTAYGSNIFPVHQVAYGLSQFIVVVSETTDTAGSFITWGNRQLKFNAKFRKDFGELLHERPNKNELDNKYEYVTTTEVKVVAKGVGKQIRGMRHGKYRPQLMVLDDLEGEENVSSPDQMRKTRKWFNEEALPALDRNGIVLYLGTILCYDSLLDHVIRERRDFESRRYAAVMKWADRQDLWEHWRKLYLEDTPSARMNATSFYEKNEAEMLEGVELLWGEYWTYLDFMEKYINIGPKSFNQEYQNEPTDEERQIFKPESLVYYTDYDMNQLVNRNLQYYAGIDFAMGKQKGDYSAIITVAKNPDTGVTYVMDAYVQRVHPDVFLEEIIRRTLEWQYDGIAVEAQMAQEWFADQLRDRLDARGYPGSTRLKKIKQRTRKELRIESMLPEVQAGKIRFSKKHTELLAQLTLYPMHKHDDAIDALQMAFTAARDMQFGEIRTVRHLNRWR